MSADLATRILDGFPNSNYSLAAFLRLCDVTETDTVPTAAVTCGRQPRLLLNPAFIAEHAPTPQKLLALVMHELHHVLLGHTTRLRGTTPLDNFVFDAVINGLVCRMFPRPEFTSLFTDYYGDSDFPACLLAPPPDWRWAPTRPAPGVRQLPDSLRWKAAAVHSALYSEGGASYREVRELLVQRFAKKARQRSCGVEDLLHDVPLLGSHGDGERDDGDRLHEQVASGPMLDVLRASLDDWPSLPEPLRGESPLLTLDLTAPTPRGVRSLRTELRRLIERVADTHCGEGGRRRVRTATCEGLTPQPSLARRSLVQRALGHTPLLYPSAVPHRRLVPAGMRAHVYIDVSASMNPWLRTVFAAVNDCRECVYPLLHTFSTEVADATLPELRAGRYRTTRGTDFACVAEHIAAHRVRRAVVITDGYVGSLTPAQRQAVADTVLGVAYVGAEHHESELAPVTDISVVIGVEGMERVIGIEPTTFSLGS